MLQCALPSPPHWGRCSPQPRIAPGRRPCSKGPQCTDAIRADVAQRAADTQRRRSAIASIRGEDVLVALALAAEHADTRMAAAERVATPEGLRNIAEGARDKDRGVARLARKQLDAMATRERETAEADAVLAQLEALASEPGPILTRVIELNRRWEALGVDDAARLARCEAARQALQERFAHEHAEQRARTEFEHTVEAWLGQTQPPATSDELAIRREDLAALRALGQGLAPPSLLSRLDEAEQRIEQWARDVEARAAAEAMVIEAEQLAASTSVDDAKLPERWQALEPTLRTPALTERFDTALKVVEERRLAQARAAEQATQVARQQVHALLHAAEQALAAGELQRARAATDEIKAHRASAGLLPKPTLQRLGRLNHELREIEQWKSFGQHQACIQMCERAEAAASLKLDPPHVAAEVQKLRNEWKALEQQHGAVPRSLRERFERACEKAYAPAKRFFAEQALRRKEARHKREEFIAAAAAHAPTLLAEPCDWRAIERWLRETGERWRGNDLGSVEPKAWKALEAQLDGALAPLRNALSAVREEAKARRAALIAEVAALAARAMERETPAHVKALQGRWQAEAKSLTLTQRDERTLWEQFRAACDAVFEARTAKRKQDDEAKREARGTLESICVQLEELAKATDRDEQQLRRAAQDLQEQWTRAAKRPDPALRHLETRFAAARRAIDDASSVRARARKAAVWQTLEAKERVCEELDRLLRSHGGGTGLGHHPCTVGRAAGAACRVGEGHARPPGCGAACPGR